MLEETLQGLGAKAMVVGHTPQTEGINWYGYCLIDIYTCTHTHIVSLLHIHLVISCSGYNCSIWRVDVGMSSGVLNSRPEVI